MKISRRKGVLERVVEYSLDLICALTKEGQFYQVSESCKDVLGYEREELENKNFLDFIHPGDYEATRAFAKNVFKTSKKSYFENCYISKFGQEVHLQWSTVWSEVDELYYCIGRDVTTQKKEQQRLREKDELHKSLIEHGADMLALLDEAGNYLYVSDSTKKALGYDPEQLVGQNALSYIHPDDLAYAQESLAQVPVKGCVRISDFRFRAADGQWRWVETVVSDQLQNPAIRALTVSSRDITANKINSIKLLESEQRFRSLFENNPDQVFYENRHGKILDVNPAVLHSFGIEKKDLVGLSVFDLLSPEVKTVSQQKLQDAFRGKLVRFEIETVIPRFENVGLRILDITKIPVKVSGEVVGVYSIIKDVTEIVLSQKIIEQQARKLNTIFESITTAFFVLDKHRRVSYINSEAERLWHINRQNCLGKDIKDLFPEEAGSEFEEQHNRAVTTGETVNYVAFLHRYNRWFEVTAYPSEEGVSVYFSDVTDRVVAEQELQRLSLVANKITNSVIIMDAHCCIEWVNASFTSLTGYTQEEVIGRRPQDFLHGPETDPGMAQLIYERLGKKLPVSVEMQDYQKSGERIWVAVDITPILDAAGNITRFISIQTDITERIKTREELKRLSLVASKTTNSVIIMDAYGRVEWVNEAFNKFSGYTLEEVLGQVPGDFLSGPDSDVATLQKMGRDLSMGLPVSTELLNYIKSGEKRWVLVDITPVLDESKQIMRIIAIQTDITDRKEAEARQLEMTRELYKQNRDLQQFTYIVSHNLRAPVANALGLANLLTRVPKNEKAFEKALANLQTSVTQLDTILKDVNMILSIRDSKDEVEKEPVALEAICQQVYENMHEKLETCGGKMSINIDRGVRIYANRAYLYSIFYNLLSNAIKYRSEERPLQVSVTCCGNTKDGNVISFSDNGCGMDMQQVGQEVFKLYRRFHPKIKGRGIGLFLVKSHVEALGGKIEVRSEVNVGTDFNIYLN